MVGERKRLSGVYQRAFLQVLECARVMVGGQKHLLRSSCTGIIS